MKKIMDISHHQPSDRIDWAKAAKEVDLMIIRVQYGSSTIDREYKKHVENCKKHGIPFGHYAYGLFVSVADAIVEAKDFINRMDKAAKFVVLDTEGDTLEKCGAANLAAASQAFIDHCKAAGLKTGFYVSHHLYRSHGLDKVKADFLWIPKYSETKPAFPCDLWQYTEKGSVSFYPGSVDLNVLNGPKDLAWFVGSKPAAPAKPAPKPAPKPVAPKPKPAPKPVAPAKKYHTAASGDSLSKIAAKHGVSLAQVIKLNPGIKPPKYVIQLGQKVRYQ